MDRKKCGFMEYTEVCQWCRTVRRFRQQPVEHDILVEALDCARLASSAGNLQPLSYVAVTNPTLTAALQPLVKWAAYLPPEQGVPTPDTAPVGFVAVVQKEGAGAFRDIDTGLAVDRLTGALWNRGVASCVIASLDRLRVQQLLKVPAADTVRLLVAFGYPAQSSRVVPMEDSVKYRLDAAGNLEVPKRAAADIVRFME